jgi:hypothetical protein
MLFYKKEISSLTGISDPWRMKQPSGHLRGLPSSRQKEGAKMGRGKFVS